eukprot:6439938-Alexandrium_andersonii.AAC.1
MAPPLGPPPRKPRGFGSGPMRDTTSPRASECVPLGLRAQAFMDSGAPLDDQDLPQHQGKGGEHQSPGSETLNHAA